MAKNNVQLVRESAFALGGAVAVGAGFAVAVALNVFGVLDAYALTPFVVALTCGAVTGLATLLYRK